jgi:3',5'-cyclic AMP phosphodiesterase CpdA
MLEIFHVSDLHFGKSDSQNNNARSLLQGISQRFPFKDNKKRYLLVTGDLTQRGEQEEYALAGQALSPFVGQVFLTPGNHDYGSFLGTDYSEQKAQHFDDPFAKVLGLPILSLTKMCSYITYRTNPIKPS